MSFGISTSYPANPGSSLVGALSPRPRSRASYILVRSRAIHCASYIRRGEVSSPAYYPKRAGQPRPYEGKPLFSYPENPVILKITVQTIILKIL